MSILKEMYKQYPKHLLRSKWELSFYLSNDIYQKEKKNIINDTFLGIKIYTHKLIKKDTAYLTEGNGFENLYE